MCTVGVLRAEPCAWMWCMYMPMVHSGYVRDYLNVQPLETFTAESAVPVLFENAKTSKFSVLAIYRSFDALRWAFSAANGAMGPSCKAASFSPKVR